MTLRLAGASTALLAGVLTLGVVLSLPVLGEGSPSSPAPSSNAAGAAPAGASDADILLAGKRVWSDAACYNCHGNNGQGGHSADFPAGPSLRKSVLDPESMLMITECGIPDTRMPAWLKGAYTELECYGNPIGPAPSGILVSGAYSEDQLKDLVAYVQVAFMKQPMPTWSDR
ncbi:MAG: cytochrome c [Devosia sp.]|uniref:c-type cytochrome n=1 Tax=Devosia sp. TaxID=1871048 RepID=UPI002606314B|nr:cytochrome c [Devosia sp.]MDB5538871.1 cytochrome c [Devosia sp.]